MPTDAQRLAARRYYEKNRDLRMEAMRTRAKTLASSKDTSERRADWVDAYRRHTLTKKERIIAGWMEEKNGVVRSFLRDYVFPNRERLSMSFFKQFSEAIADNPEENALPPLIDGPSTKDESEEGEVAEEEEGEDDSGIQDSSSDYGGSDKGVV